MKTWASSLKVMELEKYRGSDEEDTRNKAKTHMTNLIKLIPTTKSTGLNNRKNNMVAQNELDELEQSLTVLVDDKFKETIATTLIRSVSFEPQMWIASSIRDMFNRLKIKHPKIPLCNWKCEWIKVCD